jgi:hypothetical protein
VPLPAGTLRSLQITTPRGRTLVSVPVHPKLPPSASVRTRGP